MEISASMVGDLRAKTGAGLVDCKNALKETNGNVEEAITILRKKGVASAAKKADRNAGQGVIECYIHSGSKVGVMVEVNCETDFVAKTDEFHALARDIAMHIAASSPVSVKREDVSADIIARERDIIKGQMANDPKMKNKPANIIDGIVDGKMDKVYTTLCLMEQPFVKNPDQSIKDLVTEKIAKMGENIVVRRFIRYQIGE
ncbi:MAG TPA: translation elongation factor Ts [Opitutales bacterium]|nr:translation elongation factor Ts [Opitutales bacterium]